MAPSFITVVLLVMTSVPNKAVDKTLENSPADIQDAQKVAQYIAQIQTWKQNDMKCLTNFVASLHSLQIQQPLSFFLGQAGRALNLEEDTNNPKKDVVDAVPPKVNNATGLLRKGNGTRRREFESEFMSAMDLYDNDEDIALARMIDAVQNYRNELVDLAMTYANSLQHLHFYPAATTTPINNPFIGPHSVSSQPFITQSLNTDPPFFRKPAEPSPPQQFQQDNPSQSMSQDQMKQHWQKLIQQQQQQQTLLQYSQPPPEQEQLDPNQVQMLQQLKQQLQQQLMAQQGNN